MALSARDILGKGWGALRTAWLMLGICLLLVVFAEACYRAQRTVGESIAVARGGQSSVVDPRTRTHWYGMYMKDFNATRAARWKPYVYFARYPSYSGQYINIDSAGRRVTPQPNLPAVPSARVFFFGGSTMWGRRSATTRRSPPKRRAGSRHWLVQGDASKSRISARTAMC